MVDHGRAGRFGVAAGVELLCGSLARLEGYFQAVVGSAIPNRTPLDACVPTFPQASVGTGPTLPADG